MQPREELIEANGAVLWTAVQGDGPPLLLCHGGPGAYDILAPVADMVDDLALVHRYDQRGSGRSSLTPPYDVATFVEDLDALRRHWGYSQWAVGGHSWGVDLALAYSLTHPGRVSALVQICGAGIALDWGDEYRVNRVQRLSPADRQRLAELDARRRNAAGVRLHSMLDERRAILDPTDLYDPSNRDLLPGGEYPINYELNAQVNDDWKRFLRQEDLAARLRKLQMPSLVLHAEADPRPAWPSRQVAEFLPNARFVMLPRAGHFPWIEQPAILRRALRDFITDL